MIFCCELKASKSEKVAENALPAAYLAKHNLVHQLWSPIFCQRVDSHVFIAKVVHFKATKMCFTIFGLLCQSCSFQYCCNIKFVPSKIFTSTKLFFSWLNTKVVQQIFPPSTLTLMGPHLPFIAQHHYTLCFNLDGLIIWPCSLINEDQLSHALLTSTHLLLCAVEGLAGFPY